MRSRTAHGLLNNTARTTRAYQHTRHGAQRKGMEDLKPFAAGVVAGAVATAAASVLFVMSIFEPIL